MKTTSDSSPHTHDHPTMMNQREFVFGDGNVSYDLFGSISVPGFSDSPEQIAQLLGNENQCPCSILSINDEHVPNDAQMEEILCDWLERSHNDDYQIRLGNLAEYHFLRGLGAKTLMIIECPMSDSGPEWLESGPYYRNACNIYRVARRHEDSQSAFFSSIMQRNEGDGISFMEIRPAAYISVLSRLYYPPPCPNFPLSGLRFAAKDVFDVAGLKTSIGSRDFYNFYPAKKTTAVMITELLALGAVLVGKTKTTQFMNGEGPQEWIDSSCPWNPLGDGYQNPDSSSSGSASAIASYDWLDFSIGSDTCGSIACPAAAQGLFALRFSTGSISQVGTFTLAKAFDSVGIFCRSLNLLHTISSTWRSQILEKTLKQNDLLYDNHDQLSPKRILYPWSSFNHGNAQITTITDKFINAMEQYLGVGRRVIDLERKWQNSDPTGTGEPLAQYMSRTSAHTHLAGFQNATTLFREEFKAATGKLPYFDPVNAAKWKLIPNITKDDTKRASVRLETFSKWMQQDVFQANRAGVLESIMIWPFSPQEPQYRDSYPSLTPHVNWRFDIDCTAPFAGLPQIIVPIGQYHYHSRVTENTEYLPLAVSIVGPRGMDHLILDFLRDFFAAMRLPGSVKTGVTCYDI